jgi:thiamine biosynthesis protein ThiI
MSKVAKKGILISFGELFLKSEGVRNIFIKRLINNLCFFLEKNNINFRAHFLRDKIFIETEEINKAQKIISNVFGIASFSNCFYTPVGSLEDLFSFVKSNYSGWIKERETFALRVKTNIADFKGKKEKIIDEVAFIIKRKVNLSKPNREIIIELRKNGWMLYFNKNKGAGGLPSSSAGKVLVLVSGGIDSPVASYFIAKRGAENVWIHFHSFPLVSKASIEKIDELAKNFLKLQPKLKVYFIPFSKAQIEIKAKAAPEYRVLLYRRLMLKIAVKILEEEGCKALATGESLGQVSSQTLSNIRITDEAVKIPVLRPVIGMDKEEIIEISKKIGAYDISIKPQEDCCTLFVSKHQTAEGDLKKVKEFEKKLDNKKIIKECLKGLEIKIY